MASSTASFHSPAVVGDIYTPLGTAFTPSMLVAHYTPEAGWHNPQLGPRCALELDPATMALHYGQSAFDGLKAHRQPDDSLALFRAYDHAVRLTNSCARLAIPPMPVELCVQWWRDFARFEAPHLDPSPDAGFYLRPLVFGTDLVLGARPSQTYTLLILGIQTYSTPETRERRLDVLITTEYVRAAPGGLGNAKTPGNYAAGMLAHRVAMEQGCDQVLWLDAGRRRWVEELGSMNVMFMLDGTLVTPSLTDTILPGVTRDSILHLAREHRIPTDERPIALEELRAALGWGGLREAFACSTGVGITSIGTFHLAGDKLDLPAQTPFANRLRGLLDATQRGTVEDNHGWRTAV